MEDEFSFELRKLKALSKVNADIYERLQALLVISCQSCGQMTACVWRVPAPTARTQFSICVPAPVKQCRTIDRQIIQR